MSTKTISRACVIDDDPVYIYGIRRVLENSGLCDEVLTFSNGKDAFEYFRDHSQDAVKSLPELILLDLNMPVWDGWQFLDKFSELEQNKTVNLYVVSSTLDPRDLDRVSRYQSVTDIIVKPVSMEKLKNALGVS